MHGLHRALPLASVLLAVLPVTHLPELHDVCGSSSTCRVPEFAKPDALFRVSGHRQSSTQFAVFYSSQGPVPLTHVAKVKLLLLGSLGYVLNLDPSLLQVNPSQGIMVL